MATNAFIYDQTVNRAIYVHFDGHTVGETLSQHYTSQEKIDALISLGDVSELGSEVHPPEGSGHSFATPEPGVTVFYGRDRGEDGCGPRRLGFQPRDPVAYLSRIYSTAEFGYVWNGSQWTAHRL